VVEKIQFSPTSSIHKESNHLINHDFFIISQISDEKKFLHYLTKRIPDSSSQLPKIKMIAFDENSHHKNIQFFPIINCTRHENKM
jgi:hypothetical protein